MKRLCAVLLPIGCLALAWPTLAWPALAGEYACLIEPRQVLKLAAPVQGVIAAVDVDRGDHVKKGQVLARLDSDVEEATALLARVKAANDTAVESGRARLDFLKRKQGRNAQLRTTDAVSVAQLEEATADARVADATLRDAELNVVVARLEQRRAEGLLQQRRIISPIDGIVTERLLGVGEFRNDQAHVLTIAEIDPLRIEPFLPISTYGQVKRGDKAEIFPEAPVGGRYSATVTVVDQVFDAASGTIGVRLELPNPKDALPAGIHCKVRFNEAAR